jgi:hypothetical protein
MSQALEDGKFLEFLSKFSDAESLEMKTSDQGLIMERYEIFKLSQEVADGIEQALKKKIAADINMTLDADDFAELKKVIEEKAAQDNGAEFLQDWKEQIRAYETLPTKISETEHEIARQGDMVSLWEDLAKKEIKLDKVSKEKGEKEKELEKFKAVEKVRHLVDTGMAEIARLEKKGAIKLADEEMDFIRKIKGALIYLRKEPWNIRAIEVLKQVGEENQSEGNNPVARSKKLVRLAEDIAEVADRFELSSEPELLEPILEYNGRNWLGKKIYADPQKSKSEYVQYLNSKETRHKMEVRDAERAIFHAQDMRRMKEDLNRDFIYAKQQIFDELPEVRAVFGKAKEKLNKRFEKMEKDGTKVDVAFENLASVEKMEAMGTDDYERYFDSSDPTLPDRHAMIENYSEKVLAKISGELKKTLENQLGLSKAQEALKDFEGKLGDLAKSDGYAKIKYLVLLKLSRDSDVSGPTKILIRRLLSQGVEEGSIRQVLAFN